MSFENIKFQDIPIKYLKNIITSKMLPNAIAFIGLPGIGKKLTAIEFAKSLNCLSKNNYPCDECEVCKKIERSIYSDVLIIDRNFQAILSNEDVSQQKTIKINTIRYLEEKFFLQPFEGKYKVGIIEGGQSEFMTEEASNAFLKFLEEPPLKTILIFLVVNRYSLLPTIQSRTQKIFFNALPEDFIKEILKTKYNFSGSDADLYSQMCDGSIEFALKIKNEINFLETSNFYKNFNNLSLLDIIDFIENSDLEKFIDSSILYFKLKLRKNYNHLDVIDLLFKTKYWIRKNLNQTNITDNLAFELKKILA